MDNVTHALIGVALGSRFGEAGSKLRARALWLGVLASNLPDLDLLMPERFDQPKLHYLLFHRGYTHTLIATLPLALISFLLVALPSRAPRSEWKPLAWVAWLGTLLHIAADACNDYGVHPFYPWVNRWFYGDFVFIIEPLLIFALLPLAWKESRTRFGRISCGLIATLLLVALWNGRFAPPLVALFATAWGAACVWSIRRFAPFRATLAWVGAFYLVFGATGIWARSRVEKVIREGAPAEKLLGLSSTPSPANPLCWRAIATTRDGESYRARAGLVSLIPGVDPRDCSRLVPEETTAPLKAASIPESSGLAWYGEFRAPSQELLALRAENCFFKGLLQFARAPFWLKYEGGWVFGDLRYDREAGLGFAEIDTSYDGDCPPPEVTPPWIPPLDLDSTTGL